MPAVLTFPGVYVDEVPTGGARPIAAAPTSIAAFVGPLPAGPDGVHHITSLDDFERLYGQVDATNPLGVAVHQFYLNGGAEALIVRTRVAGAAPATLPLGTAADMPTLVAKTPGLWGNALRARVDYTATDFDPIAAKADASKLYNLTVSAGKGRPTERFTSIGIDPASDRALSKVLATSALVSAQVPAAADPPPAPARPAVSADATKPGADPFADDAASPPTRYYPASAGSDGAADAAPDWATAFTALRTTTEIFNILCVLPAKHGVDVPPATLSEAGRLCIDKRAFMLVDPTVAWEGVEQAVTGALDHQLTGTEFAKSAALYFPRLTIANPTSKGPAEIEKVAPCGAIAGLYARTDTQRGVWKAPAGTAAGFNGVDRLGVTMTDLENGRLNPIGVNCLRTFPGLGKLSWGARTMAGADSQLDDPSWRYVPIRRFALFIEQSLYTGTKWVVFEPNDEPLWASIRLSVGAFMNRLFRQGAFQGRTPKEAYLVKCDASNNPQDDIDRGIVNILVGFAPLKPAEFVLLHIQQLPGSVQA
jgi:phage tail sheath protein FI